MRKLFLLLPTASVVCLCAFAGCSVSTDDKGDKHDVDIRTPLGSIKVHEGNTNVEDTGLSLYPGARPKNDSDDRDRGAHVDVTTSVVGVKVVALKFQSDDAPDKVLAFYRKEMGKYGNVVDCTGGSDWSHSHERSAPVSCDPTDPGHDYREELKVGTENNQRIVAIKPNGNGSEFALVYVRTG